MASKPITKAPRCAVCRHLKRHEIEMLRVAGLSLDALSAKFGPSRDSVWRHMNDHVTDAAKAAYVIDAPIAEMAERAAAEQVSLLDYLSLIRSTLISSMLEAKQLGDRHATANLGGRAVDVLREIGKLTGQISAITSVTTNTLFVNSPDFPALELMLLECLRPFPDARRAVVHGLKGFGNHSEPIAVSEPLMMIEGPSNE